MPHLKTRHTLAIFIALTIMAVGWASLGLLRSAAQTAAGKRTDDQAGRTGGHHRRLSRRPTRRRFSRRTPGRTPGPYLHPIAAPDGTGVLTEFSPGASQAPDRPLLGLHARQRARLLPQPARRTTGGACRRRSRKADARPDGGRPLADGLRPARRGGHARPDRNRSAGRCASATARSCSISNGGAKRRTDVTIGKYDYGGLFLRMPWREGIAGEVVNAARQRNERAEGQRAMWIDVGMQVEGRKDLAHVAIFDHPDNIGYPQAWRVDGQLGVGSARSRDADWTIAQRANRSRPPPVRHLHGQRSTTSR